jgi:hypothetical protein
MACGACLLRDHMETRKTALRAALAVAHCGHFPRLSAASCAESLTHLVRKIHLADLLQRSRMFVGW